MNYLTRAMIPSTHLGPREDDPGYAKHLAAQLRVAVHKRGDRWIIEKRGKTIYSTDSVRDTVRRLREMLADV